MKKIIAFSLFIFITIACSSQKQKFYQAPYFECKGIDGKTYTLYDFKGKNLLLIFWASWCPTCKKEIPRIIARLDDFKKNNIAVLAVAINKNPDVVKMTAARHGIVGIPVALASKQMLMDYQSIRFLPTAFLINTKGIIIGKFVGELNPDRILKTLREANKTSQTSP